MTTWITGCTHFGHENIITFEGATRKFNTIEEHDEHLIKQWNDRVGPKDTIYHLGDVLFPVKAFDLLDRLNGKKKLILGNHDRHAMRIYAQYFEILGSCYRYDEILMSHYPVHPVSLQHRSKGNAHCHIHSMKVDDPRYFNVSVEHHGLAPVAFDIIKQTFEKF